MREARFEDKSAVNSWRCDKIPRHRIPKHRPRIRILPDATESFPEPSGFFVFGPERYACIAYLSLFIINFLLESLP